MLGLDIAGAALGGFATYQKGKLAMESARYNAKVLEAQNKQDALDSLEVMARRRMENKSALSAVSARMQASGIDTSQASSADFMREASSRLELEVLDMARENQMRQRAREAEKQKQLYEGRMARYNANLETVASLVQDGAAIASKRSQGLYK